MTRYQITGADRDTGEDKILWFDAATPEDAVAAATEAGLLVSEVISLGPAPVEPEAQAPTSTTPPPPINYAPAGRPPPTPDPIPTYRSIVVGARILRILGWIQTSFAIIATIVAATLFFGALSSQLARGGSPISNVMQGIGFSSLAAGAPIVAACTFWISACLLWMFASLALAIRDIAMNSFKE